MTNQPSDGEPTFLEQLIERVKQTEDNVLQIVLPVEERQKELDRKLDELSKVDLVNKLNVMKEVIELLKSINGVYDHLDVLYNHSAEERKFRALGLYMGAARGRLCRSNLAGFCQKICVDDVEARRKVTELLSGGFSKWPDGHWHAEATPLLCCFCPLFARRERHE